MRNLLTSQIEAGGDFFLSKTLFFTLYFVVLMLETLPLVSTGAIKIT